MPSKVLWMRRQRVLRTECLGKLNLQLNYQTSRQHLRIRVHEYFLYSMFRFYSKPSIKVWIICLIPSLVEREWLLYWGNNNELNSAERSYNSLALISIKKYTFFISFYIFAPSWAILLLHYCFGLKVCFMGADFHKKTPALWEKTKLAVLHGSKTFFNFVYGRELFQILWEKN